ncbi:MAG: PepSY domain-containing protein [Jiangellaceae bacterium]
MPRPTWLTAAGVGGAIVIAGSALVAVAATGPSSDPGTASASPDRSATSTPDGTPESSVTTEPSPSATSSPSSTPVPSLGDDVSAGPGASQPVVSAAEAVDIARAALAVGVPAVEVDLKFEDGRQIWDVEFVGDHEVEVDSTTGDVVKLEIGDDDDVDRTHGRGGHDDGPDHD